MKDKTREVKKSDKNDWISPANILKVSEFTNTAILPLLNNFKMKGDNSVSKTEKQETYAWVSFYCIHKQHNTNQFMD